MDVFITVAVGTLYILYTILFVLVRKSARKRRKLPGQETINPYARRDSALLASLIGMEIVLLVLHIVKVPVVRNFSFALPPALRLVALVVGLAGVCIIGWASLVLDGEFSATIELKEAHRLITAGPYRYVRHPIYSGFILLHLGVTLALANWLIMIAYNGGLMLLLMERIPREERVLHAYFGSKWDEYARNRGRFLPWR